MIKQETTNTFNKGLIMDVNPLVSPNDSLTNALNATFITMDGNEQVLQNDKGNVEVITESGVRAQLPEGYIPVGMKEHGGIIYVASVRPSDGMCQIGSFPSPQQVYNNKNTSQLSIVFNGSTSFIDNNYLLQVLIPENIDSYLPGGIEEFNRLWSNIGTLIDSDDSNVKYIKIPYLITPKLQYPLYIDSNGTQMQIKSGDLINILSSELSSNQQSNLSECIKSGQLKLSFVANTNYGGQYTITNVPNSETSLVNGIGDQWYYMEPTSTLYLDVEFNIIKPTIYINKSSKSITYTIDKVDQVKYLSHVLIIDQHGYIIPMSNNDDNFSLTLNKESNDQYYIQVVPVGTYTGYTSQGSNQVLVNPEYTDGSISQWRYTYNNQTAEFTIQYDSDKQEDLQQLNISITDLSKLSYSIIQQLDKVNINNYIDQTYIITTESPGVFNGEFHNLIDGHLYLVKISKTVNNKIIDIEYRTLYACEFYTKFYDVVYDYNTLTEEARTAVYDEEDARFDIVYKDNYSSNTTNSYYYNYENNKLSEKIQTFGSWQAELSNSNISGKLNQNIVKLRLDFTRDISNQELNSSLTKVYGGNYSLSKIKTSLIQSQWETEYYANYSISSTNQTASLTEPASTLLKQMDEINEAKCSIISSTLQSPSITIDISQSFFMDLETKSVQYEHLEKCSPHRAIDTVTFAELGCTSDRLYYNSDAAINGYTSVNNNRLSNSFYENATYWVIGNTLITNNQNVEEVNYKHSTIFQVSPVEGMLDSELISDNTILGNQSSAKSTYIPLVLSKTVNGYDHYLFPVAAKTSTTLVNIMDSMVNNIYHLVTDSSTLKAQSELNNYRNTKITVSNIQNLDALVSVTSYYDIDNEITMSDIFNIISTKFGVNDISPIISVNLKYNNKDITIQLDNLNSDYKQCFNYDGVTNPIKYYGLTKTLCSPRLKDDITDITCAGYQISSNLIMYDNLGNVLPQLNSYDYIYVTKDLNTMEQKTIKQVSNKVSPMELDQIFVYDSSMGLCIRDRYNTDGNVTFGKTQYFSDQPIADIYIDNLTYLE